MQIAAGAQTVGDAIESTAQVLLNGLYSERGSYPRKIDRERNDAARVAIENFKRDLLEVWCPDGNTKISELPVPAPPQDGSLADRLHRGALSS